MVSPGPRIGCQDDVFGTHVDGRHPRGRCEALNASPPPRHPPGVRWLLLSLSLVLAGCLTHVAPSSGGYLAVRWVDSLEDARVAARSQDKPLLVILAAGPRDGRC
ncbi:MAG: hypothetical protein AMXMBFR34_36350 [Myxococcaceae bacterium]